MTYFTLNSPACACTQAATASPWDRPEIIRSTAWPVLCSPALARYPPMLFRWMLPHLPEMLVLYDALGAPTESPPDPVALALATGLGFGFGLGLATAWTPETPTGSGANGAAPCGAETAGLAVAGAAERTELREAAKASARATE